MNLEKIHRWFSGSSCLWSKDRDWRSSGNINPVSKKDPELRKKVRVNLSVTDGTIISRIGLLTTIRLKMKKIIAWVILAKETWTKQIKKPTSGNLEKLMNVELFEEAANSIVKMVQMKSFGERNKDSKCKFGQQN